MKIFKKMCITIIAIMLLLIAGMNFFITHHKKTEEGIYRVEAKRLADDIRDKGIYDLSDYPHITGVYTSDDGDIYSSDEHYVIINVNNELYRVEYTLNDDSSSLYTANIVFMLSFLLMVLLLIYIRKHIIAPFGKLNDVPQELAKGNLAVEIPEEKSRFLGKFTWGVNMLRETIEKDRKNEISMQREKKLLLLSLSHDIKTPLSAIKLNAKAIAKGLYKDEDKRRSAAESINARADEIESFVSQITQAASEDFMTFDVVLGEAFLSAIISKITARYTPQLAAAGTEFKIDKFSDCLLSCDPDRLAECLQNLVENAIKYGDGRLIQFSFEKMDGCQLITVSNTGCTLEQSELPQIFESFHRGGNTGNRPGNGLGLFICRKLMCLMNGEVFADIHDECFFITLVVKIA